MLYPPVLYMTKNAVKIASLHDIYLRGECYSLAV